MKDQGRLRLLIVEDREDDYLLLLDELERGGYRFEYTRVDSEPALRRVLASNEQWDLAISDYSLPAMTAHDVLPALASLRPGLPCIVMSSTITEEAAVDLLRAGACDFVSKERMARLIPAIERELRESAERRRLRANQAALQNSRDRMLRVFEAVGIGTWESDLRSGTGRWSAVMEQLHGLEPGSFGGTFDAFMALVHPDDRSRVRERIALATRDGSDYRIEYRTTWPDGSEHWLSVIARTFADETGLPVRAGGVGIDITAQKNLAEQVRQAQKMESIGNLAGGVAHDFNNLLTVISGECELASTRVKSDPEAAASLDAIRTAAISASALTRQLLTFSRKQVTSPRHFRLDEHVQVFGRILRRLVEENVGLEFRLHAPEAIVRADPGQIEQVLLNLVANARDAMPEGGTVVVETREVQIDRGQEGQLPAGRYVELAIVDTGTGMPPEVMAHLFEPFFTTKPVGRGTGLGLATVHGIVTQSGGTVTVRSRQGEGTTFRILLPLTDAPETTESVRAATPAVHHNGRATILVIEDNAPLRNLAERVLKKSGYRVLVAGSSNQARQICTEHPEPISVLLADVIMPDGSGPEAAEWICRHRPDTKVIYMSGYTGDAKQLAGRGDAFLQKPFTPAGLIDTIEGVLSA